ncbi:CysE/LacA/LpxA/NodL family acetyltransferase [Streptomyces himastatinicus ATCC 53653]|uniref:CysE/LacA/LpxA/NodL family acetyltransferase n=1 Tax=Streptomyces himastatinicus ATCC 53653 TaxID=457427 RepID=D9WE16_9ACTN|nr:sugar O-acetyltransferase [Streptomyces himastatinicus]EFL21076.1 CysE/LacA/LpxA/NodL family acetyltransferase [Streptomyces himastatinicus ATCC 53653]
MDDDREATDERGHLDALKARMAGGLPYVSTEPALMPYRERCARLLDAFNATALTDDEARQPILHELLGRVGPGGWVMPRFLCEFGFFIELGAEIRINFDAVLLDCAPIVLGSRVWLAPRCQLYTADHDLDPGRRSAMWERARPITIGDDVWLGGGVIVLPGVTIGERTVVGAGSVVTKDLPADVIAAGNPARVIREVPRPQP